MGEGGRERMREGGRERMREGGKIYRLLIF